ncbi:MAG: peptidylprolyl isomerase [Betaproteobacteria bacterium]|nr:peptidylprolyl isomerase [Betaproteobacteria bacterium]
MTMCVSPDSALDCASAHGAGVDPHVPARINGVALHEPGQALDAQVLRERAYAELLRQRAVHQGLLPRVKVDLAPALDEAEHRVIEAMTDREVTCPEPTDDECRRYHAANKARFTMGQALHVRHILFAVTPGVNVHALTRRAETALLELLHKDAPAGRFEQRAAELSNCPSGAQGGDLGWLSPEDCAPELATALFYQADTQWGVGVHPRLVHTRFGLHIIEVLDRKNGTLAPYEDVAQSIRQRLQHQSRATALRQYMRLLVGQAKVEGLALDGASSPLVQ